MLRDFVLRKIVVVAPAPIFVRLLKVGRTLMFMKRVFGILVAFLIATPIFAQKVRPQADDILGT